MDLFLAAANRGGCPSVSDLTESEYSGRRNGFFASNNTFQRSFRHIPYQRDYDDDFRHPLATSDHDIMHDDAMSAITERDSSQLNESHDEHEMLRKRRMNFFKGDVSEEETGEKGEDAAAASATSPQPPSVEEKEEVLSTGSSAHEDEENPVAVDHGVFDAIPGPNLSFDTNHGDIGDTLGSASPQNGTNTRLPPQDSLHHEFNTGPLVGFLAWRRQKSHSSSALLQKANSVASLFHRKNEKLEQTTKSHIHLAQVHEEVFEQEDLDVAQQLATLKLEMAEVRTKLDAAQQRYLIAEQENAHFRECNAYLEQQNNTYQADLAQLQHTKLEAEIIIAKLKEECQHLTVERDRKARDVSDFRVALEACVEEINRIRSLLSSTQNALHLETAEKVKLQVALENQLKQISNQQVQLDEATAVLQSMREQAQTASIERANLLKKLTLAQHDRDNLRTIAKDRNAEVDAMRQELNRLKRHPISLRRPSFTEADDANSSEALIGSSPNSSSRSIGPIRVPAWVEDMLFPSKRKRTIDRSVSEKPPTKNSTRTIRKPATRGFSETIVSNNVGRKKPEDSESSAANTCAQIEIPKHSNDRTPSRESSSSKALWTNPFLARWLMHLPFFGGGLKSDTKEDSADDDGAATEPLSKIYSKTKASASSKRSEGHYVRETSSDRKKSLSKSEDTSGSTREKRDNTKAHGSFLEIDDRKKPASTKTLSVVAQKLHSGSSSSSSDILYNKDLDIRNSDADESDDESLDELKHIWASARLKIDCESSDEE
jgi:hypothetical protein